MVDINKYIAIWQLDDKKHSIPISHSKICDELEAIVPDKIGQEILNYLLCSNLVEANHFGEYLLTPKGEFLRRTIPGKIAPVQKKETRTGREWERFRKILSYYIDCVHLQEKSQEYLKSADINKKFFIPNLEPHWLKPLGAESTLNILISKLQHPAMQRLLTRRDDDEETYIGYPMSAFQMKSGEETFYSPIGLIPIDILNSSKTTLTIKLRTDEAQINQQWLEFAFSPNDKIDIINTILRLHANDQFRGMIDLLQTLPFLEKTKNRFDPENLTLTLPILDEQSKNTPCNTAVLFTGQPLRYSKTLERELKYIRDKVSDDVLDTTALAYIFREPVLPEHVPEKKFMPLPFIASNPEQMAAIDASLNKFSTKVTGPPGTGKSQVAVNIIANLIFNGKTALFTSKNHKAVEAIFERSRQVLSEPGLSLINFCTQDDPNPWYSQDLDYLMAGAGSVQFKNNDTTHFKIETEINKWRHIEAIYAPRSEILSQYTRWLKEYESTQSKIALLLGEAATQNLNRQEYLLLKQAVEALSPAISFSWRTLLSWIKWRFYSQKRDVQAQAMLKEKYAFFWKSSICLKELKENFDIISRLYQKLLSLTQQGEKIEHEVKQFPSIDNGEQRLSEALQEITPLLHDALVQCRVEKIAELSKNPELVNRLKGVMGFMKRANSPAFFQRLNTKNSQEAESGFRIFSQYYPGWAVSLLSLSKASPCIPCLFDSVIIDEASQCDPASIIPALFRAKAVVMIGDSNQFPPVIDMNALRNEFLKNKNQMTQIVDQRFDFKNVAAFDLSSVSPIMLREHFRCAEEIADYFNDAYYANELHIRTDNSKLKTPSCMGYHHAVEWIDIKNSNQKEMEAVERTLSQLVTNHYSGSIGIITPFKQYSEELKTRLYKITSKCQSSDNDSKILISTANGFQGGERDVIIFALGYNDELTQGKLWYVESPENRYIYNVAVSRARACLIIIGDKDRCQLSSVGVLNKLAQLPRPPRIHQSKDLFESPWEKALFNALLEAGIETMPQYPLVGRRLDLAFINDKIKIDIEVDGIHYHINSDGVRKMDDIYRDLQVSAVGWIVKRFWVFELRDNMASCVQQIKLLIAQP